MASNSARSTSAANAAGSRPTDSTASTGRCAVASSRAAVATSSSAGAVPAARGTGPVAAAAGRHSSSSTSTGMFTYTGPAGGWAASSPARRTMPYSTLTSLAAQAHLVNGAASACGPPTTDRFRYHCDPGSRPAPSP